MLPHSDSSENSLVKGVGAALLWCAAFAFACAWFLAATKLLRGLPPTRAVAIGFVTVEGISKARDYAGAALFYLLVPALTVLFALSAKRWHERLLRPAGRHAAGGTRSLSAALFSIPFLLAPLLFLTTRKELWGILLPPVLAAGAVGAVVSYATRRELRRIFDHSSAPYHWLLLAEGWSWLLFRYLVTGKRIAHIPTLFLEVVFVGFFLLLFWAVGLFVARMMWLLFGRDSRQSMQSFAIGGLPLVALPFAALFPLSEKSILAIIYLLTAATIVIALSRRATWTPPAVRRAVGFVILPALIFCLSYASTAATSQWVDLFHRGESLGPASDYLRGKIPYRDVFVLHGMLENGLLDAWLMRLFGREAEVALARLVVVGSMMMPMLWLIGMIALESIPLAVLTTLLAYVLSTDNQRAVPQLLVVLLLLIGVKWRNRIAVTLSGALAGFALFYGFDMGMYSVAGGLIALGLLAWLVRAPGLWTGLFAGGVFLGAAPFLIYLAIHDALGEFFRISFLTIPSIIDAVWSLPFPHFAALFRDLSVRMVADFLLTEKFRFILNPLVLAIAITCLAARFRHRGGDVTRDALLLVLVIFGLLTQRSALGRADFPHQYFSAFLIPPILVLLLVVLAQPFADIWRQSTAGARTLLAAMLVIVLPAALTILWIPDLLNARLDNTTQYRARIARSVYDFPGAQNVDRVTAIRLAVSELTAPDQPIFDFSNQPALYFFANRVNPTRFYQIPILSPIELEMEAIRDIARWKPKVVFRKSPENFHAFDGLSNDTRAPAVAAFLDDHYAFERNLRGVELWRRLDRPSRPVSMYRRMFAIPSELSRAPRQRLVFPSVAGIREGDSLWRSRLLLYNPHGTTMPLRLRYVWGSGSRDRQLHVAPRKGIELDDLVWTFFGAAETRGMLWMEYAADQRPLVRVKTYDALGEGGASIDPPLLESDAATSSTLLNELTIAAAYPQKPTRLDIGAINMGPAPARIRISATNSAGQSVGTPRESLLFEDELYLLADAAREMGISFDQTLIIHVRVLRGIVVGYASLVDPATGRRELVPAIPSHGS